MANKPRPLPGGRRDREERERWADRGKPITLGQDCEGLHSGQYVVGIDFFCDGSASKSKKAHTRVVVGRFRQSTCPKWPGYQGGAVWMETRDGEALPDDGQRYRLTCTKCAFDEVLTRSRLERQMSEVWQRHAIKVHRRNVSTLLRS